jgi:hypothetical protein
VAESDFSGCVFDPGDRATAVFCDFGFGEVLIAQDDWLVLAEVNVEFDVVFVP